MNAPSEASAELARVVELLGKEPPAREYERIARNQDDAWVCWNFLRKHGASLLSHGGGGEAVGRVTTIDGKVNVNWYHGPLHDGAELFAAPPRARQSAEPRFFIEHGVVHDRQTGKHVGAANEDDGAERLLALLKSLENDRDAWRMTAKSFSAATAPPQPRAEGMVLHGESVPVMLTAGDDPETNEPCSEILGVFPAEWAGRPARLVLAAAPGEGSAAPRVEAGMPEGTEWRWVDDAGRAMTNWSTAAPPPILDVSDNKGAMHVEVRVAPPPASLSEGEQR